MQDYPWAKGFAIDEKDIRTTDEQHSSITKISSYMAHLHYPVSAELNGERGRGVSDGGPVSSPCRHHVVTTSAPRRRRLIAYVHPYVRLYTRHPWTVIDQSVVIPQTSLT